MKIEDYELLLKLHEIGTIRGTAKEILISQPAVSQRLKYIESYFEEALFIRTQKQLVLTPIGELVLDHARSVLKREIALKERIIQRTGTVRGSLSIASSTVISQRFLPRILSDFTNRYPDVSVDLVSGISEEIIRKKQDYHVCIVRGNALKDLISIRLFEDPLYIFDTKSFTGKGKLKRRPLISFKTGDSMNRLVDRWLIEQHDQIKPVKMIQVDQIETCKQFMKEGLGMAVLPLSVSHHLLQDYPNMPLLLEGKTVTRDTWLCFQKEVRRLPQVNEFINIVTNTDFQQYFKND